MVATKDRIYETAVELFYERGYNGTTLRDICSRAGVRPPSVYYHFENKQGLLYAVLKKSTVDSTELLRSRIEGVEGPEERLAAAIQAHVEWHTSRQLEAFVADAEMARLEGARREEVRALRRAHEQIFRDIFDAGIEAGDFAQTDPALLTRMLLTGATGVSAWYREDGPEDAAAIADVFVSALLGGLRS